MYLMSFSLVISSFGCHLVLDFSLKLILLPYCLYFVSVVCIFFSIVCQCPAKYLPGFFSLLENQKGSLFICFFKSSKMLWNAEQN